MTRSNFSLSPSHSIQPEKLPVIESGKLHHHSPSHDLGESGKNAAKSNKTTSTKGPFGLNRMNSTTSSNYQSTTSKVCHPSKPTGRHNHPHDHKVSNCCDKETLSMISSFVDYSHWQDLCGSNPERLEFRQHRQKGFSLFALIIVFVLVTITLAIWMRRILHTYKHTILTIPVLVIYASTLIGLFYFLLIKIYQIYYKKPDPASLSSKNGGIDEYTDPSLVSDRLEHDLPTSRFEQLMDYMKGQNWFETTIYFWLCYCGQLLVIQLVILRKDYNYITEQMPPEDTLPEGPALLTLIIPIVVYLVFKGVRFRYAIYAICWAYITDVYLMIHYGLHQSWIPITLGWGFSMFLISEYHSQSWNNFIMTYRLHHTMGENSRMAEEIKANELRHMIGNVAHDLKTPLSSFISGMEVIQKVSHELYEDLQYLYKNSKMVLEHCECAIAEQIKNCRGEIDNATDKVSTILEVSENVTNTNAFMIMTINRCIDYNKTLFGLKLNPKPELFMLKESVDFTIKCLKNSYEHVTFECDYSSEALRGGEVMLKSDKQWLQENLLCLVGNAAKYSEKDFPVNITMTMVPRDRRVIPASSVPMSPSNRSANNSRSRTAGVGSPQQTPDPSFNELEEGLARVFPASSRERDEIQIRYCLKISVLDSGPGILPEFQNQLFEEPAQAARINGGTGLGLYSLAKRVEALGGDYGVENRKEIDGHSGSRFWFTLPFEETLGNSVSMHSIGGAAVSKKKPLPASLPSNATLPVSANNSFYSTNGTNSAPGTNISVPSSPNVKKPPATVASAPSPSTSWQSTIAGIFTTQAQPRKSIASVIPLRSMHEYGSSEQSSTQSSIREQSGTNKLSMRSVIEESPSVSVRRQSLRQSSMAAGVNTAATSLVRVIVNEDETSLSTLQVESVCTDAATTTTCQPPSLPTPSVLPTPVKTAANDAIKSPNTNEESSTPVKPVEEKKNLHVLVVDDSPAILKMTALALKKQGYKVTTAENGQQAVDKVKVAATELSRTTSVETIDIILMDFQMPVMDGIEAIQTIRRLESVAFDETELDKCKSEGMSVTSLSVSSMGLSDNKSGQRSPSVTTPVAAGGIGATLSQQILISPIIIGFSAKSDESQIQEAYEYGMDAFLPKPFTIASFQSLLSICMNKDVVVGINSGGNDLSNSSNSNLTQVLLV